MVEDAVDTGRCRGLAETLHWIDAHDLAPRRTQDPRGQLAHQAEADHGYALADTRIGLPDPLEGDGTHRPKGALFDPDVVGHARAEVARHLIHPRVDGVSPACTRHAV